MADIFSILGNRYLNAPTPSHADHIRVVCWQPGFASSGGQVPLVTDTARVSGI